MTMMIIDGLLILVIAWGVIYAWRTSASMQSIKNEMKPVTRQLGSYLNTIGQHLQQLRETTESNRRTLTEQLPQAKALKDDFEVLLDHGNRLAERLDVLLEQAYAVERDLRAANAGIASTSSPVQTPVTRDTIRQPTYTDVMQRTPVPQGGTTPVQNPYGPFPPSFAGQPYPPQPNVQQQPVMNRTDQLEAARAQAMQTRGEIIGRLRGVRV